MSLQSRVSRERQPIAAKAYTLALSGDTFAFIVAQICIVALQSNDREKTIAFAQQLASRAAIAGRSLKAGEVRGEMRRWQE